METAGYRLCSRQQAACPLKFNPQAPEPRTTRPQPQRVCRPQRPMLKPFTSSTPSEELQMLFFSETLAMVSNTGEPQGELTIDVQRGTHKNISGYLSWNLEIKEQQSHEFIKFHILPMERKMSLLKQEDQLAMTRSIKEGEEVKTEVTFFPWHSTAGFISESANLLLLRVMAWRRMVPSNARFLALDMEGKLCSSTYQALGSQTIQVDHQQVEVFIVEQTVHSDEGIPTSCQFYLLPDGHLAKRVQVGSPGCCMITKMPVIRERDEIEPRPVFEKKPLMWEEDMELYSRFLDRKEELRLSHTRYLQQHPEATALISDFLLFLLLRQPADVVTFAAEHFGPFATCWSPTPGLRSSNRPSPFRALDPESF
ncbi:PREDICTED: ciliogenesis-associated TTC17-interacting protein isoform X6 [Hipposideros armiger]|uniref:Ciliogenesis-associated TTC17-interacting protein n=1 Tax=Hipposideros armiger TaxID=186990 RepID=A0A8B7QZI0_HIPAR|nr:PREDICTED: ciliogenesis-associated TTC17-interacting protein isoform X6 [Hipposideros armiger]